MIASHCAASVAMIGPSPPIPAFATAIVNGHRANHIGFDADIAVDNADSAALRPDLCRRTLEFIRVTPHQCHRCAVARERLRTGEPDAAAAAGDQRVLPDQ